MEYTVQVGLVALMCLLRHIVHLAVNASSSGSGDGDGEGGEGVDYAEEALLFMLAFAAL